ncbi:DUF4221 family protein [Roseivirga echinicomitans]
MILFLFSFRKKNSTDFDEKFSLTENGTNKIVLDNETGFSHYSMQIDSTIDGEFFSFINEKNNSVYIYNHENSNLVKKVKIDSQGPNGMGNLQLSSHKIISLDSILIYNLYTRILYLTNSESEVYWKENLADHNVNASDPNLEPSLSSPIIKVGDNVFFACSIDSYSTDYSSSYSVMRFNLKTGERKYLYALPEVYNSGYWGAVFKYIPSLDFNKTNGQMVLNYPIDPRLYVVSIDGEGKASSHFESTRYINDMNPLRNNISYGTKKDHSVSSPKTSTV